LLTYLEKRDKNYNGGISNTLSKGPREGEGLDTNVLIVVVVAMVLVAAACGLTFFFKSTKGGEAKIGSRENGNSQGRRLTKKAADLRKLKCNMTKEWRIKGLIF